MPLIGKDNIDNASTVRTNGVSKTNFGAFNDFASLYPGIVKISQKTIAYDLIPVNPMTIVPYHGTD